MTLYSAVVPEFIIHVRSGVRDPVRRTLKRAITEIFL